jgi:hypothetical protein
LTTTTTTTTRTTATHGAPAGEPLTELARYFALVGAAAASGADTWLPMFSGAVDAAWHRLTLDSAALADFCTLHAGVQVGHQPARGHGRIAWVEEYERRFGTPLPHIWFTRADGTVDAEALEQYERTGIVVTGWDCAPAPTDPEPEDGLEAPPSPTHTAPHPQEKPREGYGEGRPTR